VQNIVDLINFANEQGASDLHLVVNYPPFLRVNGDIKPIQEAERLTPEAVERALQGLATPAQLEEFRHTLELDFGETLPRLGRIRCNAARQRGAISLAIRLLPPEIPTIDELGLPQTCKELAMYPRGLVIISGPTGAGKSTTLAAMINYINLNTASHIISIEDPIEYTYTNINSAITQRELGSDTHSFADALKHVLRQDPDVIMVGEMRDLDTAAAVLSIAESGHLVLTTGHATSAYQCIERVIDLFPPEQRYLAQIRLASLIIGALCQILVPLADGSGRTPAVEVMLGNVAVKNLIREGKIYQLSNVIHTSSLEGMETLDQALVRLYLRGMITLESVGSFCNDREEVERLIGKVPVLAHAESHPRVREAIKPSSG
jgi:twitching motility protein PilT